MGRILIVDDEPGVLSAFKELLTAEGHDVVTQQRAEMALADLGAISPDLVILDICMPGLNGLDALTTIRQQSAKLPVIVMTGRGTMSTAIEATKRGAFEYHLKPFDPPDMLRSIERALQASRLMNRQVSLDYRSSAELDDVIVGRTAAMQSVFKTIGRVAPTDATVLIRGETGTGKELVARAIYQHSGRANKPMHVVNCAALAETLLESELFGHERGAFTGAIARRIGKFEQASNGTLLLDEIGEISLTVQAKLLRVLQGQDFQRLGSNDTVRTDVRILAATNRNLEKAIEQGTFREDLYHRLNVVTIHLPPLRERKDDLPQLIEYFLRQFSRELRLPIPVVTDAALSRLLGHDWPGNVRELEYCIQRALILTQGHPIQAEDIDLSGFAGSAQAVDGASTEERLTALAKHFLDSQPGNGTHSRFLAAAERALVAEAMHRAAGNQSGAARLLDLPRATLHARMQRLGVLPPSPETGDSSES